MTISIHSIDFLAARFPPSVCVKQLSQITSEAEQTIRNKLAAGVYPIPSFSHGRKRLFRLIDIANYIDRVCGLTDHNATSLAKQRGRPTKVMQEQRREREQMAGSTPAHFSGQSGEDQE
jgi:hypothetical protein